MRTTTQRLIGFAVLAAVVAFSGAALASGQPVPWQMELQPAASEKMIEVHKFHNLLLLIITAIVAFVLALLVWVMIRYNARSNPTPSKVAHNTMIEIAWTIIPVIILVVIAIPSFRLLMLSDNLPPADITIKAIGKQWYWSYEYPDNGNFTFDALMVEEKDLQPGQPRLLAATENIVVPVGKVVRIVTTASDVIHSFALPSFGVKIDAVPGRLNETWFRAEQEGIFYGQCSELCGARHAFMPIAVEVVSQERFDAWIAEAQAKFARSGAPETFASADGAGQAN